MYLSFSGSGGFVGGPCPLSDSWLFDAEEGEWTKLDDCSTPTNDAVMIRVSCTVTIYASWICIPRPLNVGMGCSERGERSSHKCKARP